MVSKNIGKYSIISSLNKTTQGDNNLWLVKDLNKNKYVLKYSNSINSKNKILIEKELLLYFKGINGIISVHDYFIDFQYGPVLVTPYYPLDSIKNVIRNRQLSFQEIIIIFIKLANSLDKIHLKNGLHLDIKLSNILLKNFLTPIIIDFEYATVNTKNEISELSSVLNNYLNYQREFSSGGTWEYMAPEQFDLPIYKLLPNVDIYSLGISLFEAITNYKPFQSTEKSINLRKEEYRKFHQSGLLSKLIQNSEILTKYSKLNEIIKKMTLVNTNERFQTMNEVSIALSNLQ